jgi:hypothetical protein
MHRERLAVPKYFDVITIAILAASQADFAGHRPPIPAGACCQARGQSEDNRGHVPFAAS